MKNNKLRTFTNVSMIFVKYKKNDNVNAQRVHMDTGYNSQNIIDKCEKQFFM